MAEGPDRPAPNFDRLDPGSWPEAAVVGDMDHGPELDGGGRGFGDLSRGGRRRWAPEDDEVDLNDPSVPPWVLSSWILEHPPDYSLPIGEEPITLNPGLLVTEDLAKRIDAARARGRGAKPKAGVLRSASLGRQRTSRRVRWREPVVLGAQEPPEPEALGARDAASGAGSAPSVPWYGGDSSSSRSRADEPVGSYQWWRGGGQGETDEWDSWSGSWAARSEGWCAEQSGSSSWRGWSSSSSSSSSSSTAPAGSGTWGWRSEDGCKPESRGKDVWWQPPRSWDQASAAPWQAEPHGDDAPSASSRAAEWRAQSEPAVQKPRVEGTASASPSRAWTRSSSAGAPPPGGRRTGDGPVGGERPPWAWSARGDSAPEARRGDAWSSEKPKDPLWENWVPRDHTPDRLGGKPHSDGGLRKPKRDWRHPEGVCITELQEGAEVGGRVTNVTRDGAFVDIGAQKDGLLGPPEVQKLGFRPRVNQHLQRLRIGRLDPSRNRISLHVNEWNGPIGDGGWRGASRDWSPKKGGASREGSPSRSGGSRAQRSQESPGRPRGAPGGAGKTSAWPRSDSEDEASSAGGAGGAPRWKSRGYGASAADARCGKQDMQAQAPYRGSGPLGGWADGGTGGTRSGRE